jgi:alpha-tubulin suppressor-like RCC1 family protein
MATNFIFNNGGNNADFSDVFIPVSAFAQGQLWSWGQAVSGQLGDNTTVNKSSPVQTVSGGINWKSVSVGGTHETAIKTDGTLWLWGNNAGSQLGDNTFASKSSPIQTVSSGTNWLQVSGGSNNTSAIKSDGTLWIWGNNAQGQLGDNTVTVQSSPIQTVAGGTNWKQVALSSSSDTSTAIKTDGTLWLWGDGRTGELGNNNIIKVSSPIQTVSGGTNWKQVDCGSSYTAAIKTDGTLWLWGLNSSGQLGDNTRTNVSSPIQTVSGGTNWKQVACGANHTASIKTDGTLWLWGRNWILTGTPIPTISTVVGMIGTNVQILNYSSPVQTVSGGTNWKQVDCGSYHTSCIKTDGTLWLWGLNSSGQLGDNTVVDKSSPIQTVSGGTNWKQVSGGGNTTSSVQNNF